MNIVLNEYNIIWLDIALLSRLNNFMMKLGNKSDMEIQKKWNQWCEQISYNQSVNVYKLIKCGVYNDKSPGWIELFEFKRLV